MATNFKDGRLTFNKTTGSEKDGNLKVLGEYEINGFPGNCTHHMVLKAFVMPALENQTIPAAARTALVKHLTTTGLPVFFRKKLPNGFKGTFVEAMRKWGEESTGIAARSETFTAISGLLAFKKNDLKAALPLATADGFTEADLKAVLAGQDPWLDNADETEMDAEEATESPKKKGKK